MLETNYCPTCGKPTTFKESPEWLMGHWNGRFANIIAALIEARRARRGLNIDELVRAAYIDRDHATQIPVNADKSIRAILVSQDEKLRSLGWKIMGPKTTGNGFWLVPLEND